MTGSSPRPESEGSRCCRGRSEAGDVPAPIAGVRL